MPVGAPLDVRPDRITVVFRPDSTIRDGSYAASAWLQELPKALTKVTWDNVVAISPKLAEKHRLANGDIVALSSGDATIEGAAWILPGQAERTVTLTLGYGRSSPDQIFDGLGYDAGRLRSKDQPWVLAGASLAKTGRKATLATTQDHNTMEGHDFVRVARVGQPVAKPHEGQAQPLRSRDQARGPEGGRLQRGARLGHGDRHRRLHRLQRLRRGLPEREQHRRGRQGAGGARTRHALAAHRPLLLLGEVRGAGARRPRHAFPSRCPACIASWRLARSVARSRRRCTTTRA